MGNWIEAQNLPFDEKVYLKKDFFGWRVVEPPTRWYHYIIGSRKNLFILFILMFLALCFYLGMREILYNQVITTLANCNNITYQLNYIPIGK
jgi:hypothetical protein